jgi:molybdenum cofactor cytidylyltransferase
MPPAPEGLLRLTGVVPAAGASRRMGQPKALLTLLGRTFLDRVVTALRGGGCDRVIIVVEEGRPAIEDEARRTGAEVLVNKDPGEGPITSLRLALSAVDATADGIVYLPLDYPLVTAESVSGLIAAATESGSGLTLPRYRQKRGHPAIFRRSLFAQLADPKLEGGARIVVHAHLETARLVDWPDATVITDVDTPDAYQALRARHESGASA